VRRIFAEFAAGRSPKVIARRLSDDGIPGPRGILWRDTAIRGHRQRGTGLLNNEFYLAGPDLCSKSTKARACHRGR
jgi:site-specific DNA recombinase